MTNTKESGLKFTLPITTLAGRGPAGGGAGPAAGKGGAGERLVRLLTPHRPAAPLSGPVHLSVTAYFPIPMYWSGKKILQAEEGRLRPTRPGLDNLVRCLKEGLTASGFWQDDKQVTGLRAVKRYNDGLGARWEVEISGI